MCFLPDHTGLKNYKWWQQKRNKTKILQYEAVLWLTGHLLSPLPLLNFPCLSPVLFLLSACLHLSNHVLMGLEMSYKIIQINSNVLFLGKLQSFLRSLAGVNCETYTNDPWHWRLNLLTVDLKVYKILIFNFNFFISILIWYWMNHIYTCLLFLPLLIFYWFLQDHNF